MPGTRRSGRFSGKQRGNAILELALAIPVIMLLCAAAADFSRLFFNGVTVADASCAGSSYGALRGVNSAQLTRMEEIALQSAADVNVADRLGAVADRYCDCPDNPASGPSHANAVDCISGTCPDYGPPRVYVRTIVQNEFNSVLPYPGVPRDSSIRRRTYMRVQ